jgi:hypothetical protein
MVHPEPEEHMAAAKKAQSKSDTNSRSAARRTASRRRSSSQGSSGSGSSSPQKIETDSKVAARAQLDEASGAGIQDGLEQRAKDQEATQQRLLREGVATGDEKKAAEARAKRAEVDPASVRAGGALDSPHAPGAQGGLVDQLSSRGDGDALTGHFVKIDLNADGVPERLVESGRDYGVYLEPASVDPDTGYPLTARVRLRDDTHEVVVVPHDSLRPAVAGGR